MARIYCFGDSITFGESDLNEGGWVERLKTYYLRRAIDSNQQKTLVYNLGIASDTTDGLENRFVNELTSRVSTKTKNIIFLSFGSNDLTRIVDRFGESKNRVPLEYFITKLTSCIEYAQSKNIPVVVNTILPFASKDDGVENDYQEVRFSADVELYNQAIRTMCDRASCTVLDLFGEFSDGPLNQLLSKDGLHPNEKGHQLIFNKVKDLLDTLI